MWHNQLKDHLTQTGNILCNELGFSETKKNIKGVVTVTTNFSHHVRCRQIHESIAMTTLIYFTMNYASKLLWQIDQLSASHKYETANVFDFYGVFFFGQSKFWHRNCLVCLQFVRYTVWLTRYFRTQLAASRNSDDTIRYDNVCLTCSKKLTGNQLSLPHGTNKKLKCKTKNKWWAW